jgi:hypothetical protein
LKIAIVIKRVAEFIFIILFNFFVKKHQISCKNTNGGPFDDIFKFEPIEAAATYF